MVININFKDVVWSYLGVGMSMFSNILMMPLIVYFLEGDMLGLWYVFGSIGALTALFDFGFSTTFARNITYCWSGAKVLKKESVKQVSSNVVDWFFFNNVLVACKKIYTYIALTAFVLLFTVGSFYVKCLTEDKNNVEIFIAWAIYGIAIVLNLYYGYYISFLRGVGAIVELNKSIVLARIIQMIVCIIMLAFGYGIVGASTAYFVYGIIFRILCKNMFYNYKSIGNKIKECIVDSKKVSNIVRVVWHNAWRDGIVSMGNFFSDQATVILCSFYFSLEQTGVYSLSVQIVTAVAVVSSVLYSTKQPEIQQAFILNNRSKVIEIMSLIVVSFMVFYFVIFWCTILVGVPILEFIDNDVELSFNVLILMGIYQFVLKFRNCYTSYFSCTNRIPYVWSFILSSFLSILLCIFVIEYVYYDICAILIAQIFSQMLFNFWYWPMKVYKEIDISFFDSFKLGISNIYDKGKMYRSRFIS